MSRDNFPSDVEGDDGTMHHMVGDTHNNNALVFDRYGTARIDANFKTAAQATL